MKRKPEPKVNRVVLAQIRFVYGKAHVVFRNLNPFRYFDHVLEEKHPVRRRGGGQEAACLSPAKCTLAMAVE